MKITLLTETLEGKDGWSRYARDLSRALAQQGHIVSALVTAVDATASWCTQRAILRPALHTLTITGWLLQAFRVRSTLTILNPDVVHTIVEPYASLVPRRWKTFITLHGSYAVIPFQSGAFARWMTRRAFVRAQKIVAVSHCTKKFLMQSEPALFAQTAMEEKIVVVHNAITLTDDVRFIAHLQKKDVKRIIGVGAVKNRKGYVQAVRALAALKKETGIEFQYDIIGSLTDRAYVQTLEQEIQTLGLMNEVRLLGVISDQELTTAYEKADLFLLLSLAEGLYIEGFVLAFLEAAARGVPCIGPTTGGCPEAIDNGKTGFVCDPQNPEAVASKIAQILEQNVIVRSACRAWAEAHDIAIAVRTIEMIYRHHEK